MNGILKICPPVVNMIPCHWKHTKEEEKKYGDR